jgi:hypothetical protein
MLAAGHGNGLAPEIIVLLAEKTAIIFLPPERKLYTFLQRSETTGVLARKTGKIEVGLHFRSSASFS